MRGRIAAAAAVIVPALLANGCVLLPGLAADNVPPERVMPALVAPSYQESSPPSAERLSELGAEERATYQVYRAVNHGVVNITS